MVKLNLGSGYCELDGYENIDLLNGRSAYPLDYETETVDEIRASHILEHFGIKEVKNVLKNWVDKLRPGGVIKIAVPNFQVIAENYLKKQNAELTLPYTVGGQTDENDFHKIIFDKQSLNKLMIDSGLVDIKEWKSEVEDCASLPVSLNLQGTKPERPKASIDTKIYAVMSLPRLAFTDNMFCAMKVFPELGISMDKGTGVFWGQILTKLMERHIDDGTEYIITCDYDTWFTREHVIRLLQLMAENPDVDAIIPLQIKRENELPMFSIIDEEGKCLQRIPITEFDKPLVHVLGGHFGLTILRVSALKKLKKPWFLPKPDKDGGWSDEKIDEDIHFWQNFHESGCKACLAPEINIGHIQLMCTFPGKPRRQFKPEQVYMTQVERGLIPDHCIPKVELIR